MRIALLVAMTVMARHSDASASAHSAFEAREHLCPLYDRKCDGCAPCDRLCAAHAWQNQRIYKNNMAASMETDAVPSGLDATGRTMRALHGVLEDEDITRKYTVAFELLPPQQPQWSYQFFKLLAAAPQVVNAKMKGSTMVNMIDAAMRCTGRTQSVYSGVPRCCPLHCSRVLIVYGLIRGWTR